MPAAPKKATIVSSRAQSLMGSERVLDETEVETMTERGAVMPPPIECVRPSRKVIRATSVDREAATWNAKAHSEAIQPDKPTNGVALTAIAHPSSPPADISPDAIETIEIELEDTFPIESNVPLPPARPSRYPLESLKFRRDFFFVPGGKETITGSIRRQAQVLGIKITTRCEFKHRGKLGVGVWRIDGPKKPTAT